MCNVSKVMLIHGCRFTSCVREKGEKRIFKLVRKSF